METDHVALGGLIAGTAAVATATAVLNSEDMNSINSSTKSEFVNEVEAKLDDFTPAEGLTFKDHSFELSESSLKNYGDKPVSVEQDEDFVEDIELPRSKNLLLEQNISNQIQPKPVHPDGKFFFLKEINFFF